MNNTPTLLQVFFGITTLLSVFLFYRATKKSWLSLLVLGIWLIVQTGISLTGFYTVTNTVPLRFLLLVLPPFIFIAFLFLTPKGKNFIDSLDTKSLTILHIVRIPVELVLFYLFIYKQVPQLMTFEGRNFDIVSGLSAPFIYYFGYIKKTISEKIILIWNIVCLFLLINIVVNAIFSAPFPFQKFAFDQPNIGVLYFPYVWLPCCIVPIVLFSHLVCIRQLLKNK